MKKILALVLCLVMAFSLVPAMAEDVAAETEVVAVEELFDGVWVQFEQGFELYLPADWVDV